MARVARGAVRRDREGRQVTPGLALGAGLLAGASHVVTGPDHVAAVLPLSFGQGTRATRVGLSWGFGHAVGVIALALLGQGLRTMVDIDVYSAWAEVWVGGLLVLLGVWTWWRTRQPASDHAHVEANRPTHAFGFGLLHGMAGTGHLLGVLPTLALEPLPAATYVVGYLGAASVVMAGVSAISGRGLTKPGHVRIALRASAVFAVAVGSVWVVTSA